MSHIFPAYPADKVLFPCAHDEAQAERVDSTFYQDFKIAERFSFDAVRDTYRRAHKGWKNSIKYLTELCAVMNHLGWEWHQRNDKLAAFYFDRYNEISAEVYKSDEDGKNISGFTDDEVRFFWSVMD